MDEPLKPGDRVEMRDEHSAVPVGTLGTVVEVLGDGAYSVRWDVPVALYYLREDLRKVEG